VKKEDECHVPEDKTQDAIERIVERLRASGQRRTEALEDLLRVMLSSHRPFLLAELSEEPRLARRDQATIYRLVMKLKDLGIISQINFGNRGNYFQLNLEDHHHDYLLCSACGRIEEVPMPCVLHDVERTLAERFGWKNLRHSLAFHGVCPACAVAQ